ncbi:hyaluronidase PH-20-like [Sorex araneus]|uniref:hyaluronidase PH-20-like n=1 Tax=Sorex araneus TaxID=42254 RepID=UPI0024340A3F|nr:hyaluronidase PH-20-like [Sorex araneus]
MEVLLVRSFVEFSGVSKAMFIFFFLPIFLTEDYRAPPIVSNTTYVLAWNGPNDVCFYKYKISVDVSIFSLIGNPRFGVTGQNVTLLYVDNIGEFPYLNLVTKEEKYGVIPQSGDLNAHLQKAESDIIRHFPEDRLGLAVIDLEEWKPIWIRNRGDRMAYRKKSIDLVKKVHPTFTEADAEIVAKKKFEYAAKNYMLKTLQLAQRLRPKNYWGYHNFPDCYNYYYRDDPYSGSCPEIEKKRNNELDWLWNETTALYPSIYLSSILRDSQKAALYSRNRINEALRISKVRNRDNPLPVFVYMRSVYMDNSTLFLSETDLVHTIGETLALGASGIVIWGSYAIAQTEVACRNLKTFERETLSPYLINVTLAAKMCHQALCQDRGFCTRKDWNSNDYLHLNPKNFVIKFAYCDKFIVYGEPSIEDLQQFSDKFDCTCFANVTCKKNDAVENVNNIRVCINEEICISAFVDPGGRRKSTTKPKTTATDIATTAITIPAAITTTTTKTTPINTPAAITTTTAIPRSPIIGATTAATTAITTPATTTSTTKRKRIF